MSPTDGYARHLDRDIRCALTSSCNQAILVTVLDITELAANIPEVLDIPHLPLARHMPVTATASAQMSYHWLRTGAPLMSTVTLQRPLPDGC